MTLSIKNEVSEKLACRLGIVEASISVYDEEKLETLRTEILHKAKNGLDIVNEKDFDVISSTREAYKVFGKEPSRYRPSAEALCKRIRTDKGLYSVNNVVDVINLLSISTKFSIGGFDADFIEGNIALGIGNKDTYNAIGRGELNIEYMPGLTDDLGFFGTPTSDSQRTMIRNKTKNLLLVFYDFGNHTSLHSALELAKEWVAKYCSGKKIKTSIIS